MVDFNQALTFAEAMERCRALDDEGVYWIEEPIRHDDYRHAALIAGAVSTPIQAGENFLGLPPMAASLSAAASDYLMLDLDRIGGVSGWRERCRTCGGLWPRSVVASFPRGQRPSAGRDADGPLAGVRRLGGADFGRAPQGSRRKSQPLPGPGVGLRWNEEAVSKFRLDNG